jgi:hypothetical protein
LESGVREGEALEGYLSALVRAPRVWALWEVGDRGVPVFVHSVDVLLLCLERFPEWRSRHPDLDLPAVVVGALLHDASKLTSRALHGCSHSHLMSVEPERAVDAARLVLEQVGSEHGLSLDPERRRLVEHIVASHHGRFGKVHPRTAEAHLVHLCDLYSSTNHRLAPVDANDILPLLQAGCRMQHVATQLGVGREVVKTRLAESCRAEHVRDWVELMGVWRLRGAVAGGTPERAEQIQRVRALIEVSRQAPSSLLSPLRAAASYHHCESPTATSSLTQ